MPGDRRPPVVARDHRRRLAEGVEEADDIADQMEQRVVLDRLRHRGLTVAALVGRDGVIAGLRQRDQLMAPRIPGLGEAVAEDDQRPLARLGHVHAQAVGLDESVGDLHGQSSRPVAVPAAVFSPCWFAHQTSTTTRVRPFSGCASLTTP